MEELTTSMHAEFMAEEISEFDLRVMGAFACIRRGEKKEDVFKKYKLSEPEYNENVDRVLSV